MRDLGNEPAQRQSARKRPQRRCHSGAGHAMAVCRATDRDEDDEHNEVEADRKNCLAVDTPNAYQVGHPLGSEPVGEF